MYEVVIGLEVHVELKTKSKIFCSCSTEFGSRPNSQVCPVCLGMPGVLPVLNKKVVEFAVLAGLSLGCTIASYSKLDRKNYFYPDLPKAYQISQYDLPLCQGGHLMIQMEDTYKRIGITRIHIEEDAGKLMHEEVGSAESLHSLVDLNRGGVPLIEIVSEPDLSSPEEAVAFVTQLKAILGYLAISDCRMEEGSLRCDANISIRKAGEKQLGTKAEIKNLNSFKTLQKALTYEIGRQKETLGRGEAIIQETRTWDDGEGTTLSMRSKEEAHDYRYFPEPDLMPIVVDGAWLERIKERLPELPDAKKKRFMGNYDLSAYEAELLTRTQELADYFEETCGYFKQAKKVSNWMLAEFSKQLNTHQIGIEDCKVSPQQLAALLTMIDSDQISGKMAKVLFAEMFITGKDPQGIAKEKNMMQISDEKQLIHIIEKIIHAQPGSVEDYRAGKEKALDFLVGQAMKETKGQANPKLLTTLFIRMLSKNNETI